MIARNRVCKRAQRLIPQHTRRWLSSSVLDRLSRPVQSYISLSNDPYANLSIEHYLLQKTASDSAVLLLYINRPSIIIGRNQNPWLEVNLALLDAAHTDRPTTEPPGLGPVDLVRRRSGGGTVFHDEGNVNWTVICPSRSFTRDKHAEMVVRALRSCGVDRSRVNERHDIVLDQGEQSAQVDASDTHKTPYTSVGGLRPLKVSGSAYKLTRQRALHHGTCLLSSPNLNIIPDYLHSPARRHMTARGVESVSSPVSNVLLRNEDFIRSVQQQFAKLYSPDQDIKSNEVGDEWLTEPAISDGYGELKSLDWTYLQTPQFNISNHADETSDVALELTVRNGVVHRSQVASKQPDREPPQGSPFVGLRLHEVASWPEIVQSHLPAFTSGEHQGLSAWLQTMLPVRSGRPKLQS